MVGGDNLGEILRLGEVCLMTTDAEHGGVQLCRLDRGRIVGMLRQRPMARLAGNSLVHALAFHFQDVGVAAVADLMAGVRNRPRCDLLDRIAAVVSVLPKTARDENAAQHQKQNAPHQEDRCQPEEVTRIFEGFHSWIYNHPFGQASLRVLVIRCISAFSISIPGPRWFPEAAK